jgi:hypothetical protein
MVSNKIIVIYSYYEKNDEYIKNFQFFLNNALYDDIDYLFCINGRKCSIDIPKNNNIILLDRDNNDFDFGAYADALKTININTYDYFFFINTSVRGPFLPPNERHSIRWTEPFLQLLTGDVKLVGTSINILNAIDPEIQKSMSLELLLEKGYTPPFIHVQSQLFLLNKESLNFLISKQFFNQTNETNFNAFVALREVLMSQLILKNGWNINCILPKYQGLDYRKIKNDINSNSVNSDPYYPNAYFGQSIRPYDVIFIKTNRNVSTDEIAELTNEYDEYNKNKTGSVIEGFISNNSTHDIQLQITQVWQVSISIIILYLLYVFYKRHYFIKIYKGRL